MRKLEWVDWGSRIDFRIDGGQWIDATHSERAAFLRDLWGWWGAPIVELSQEHVKREFLAKQGAKRKGVRR